jgi:hypothetical protein
MSKAWTTVWDSIKDYVLPVIEIIKHSIEGLILIARKAKELLGFGGGSQPQQQPHPPGMQHGGHVGGSGRGDIVPAMLEPGEYVVRVPGEPPARGKAPSRALPSPGWEAP